MDKLKPLAMKRVGESLEITWSDSEVSLVSWRTLRQHCPCATCNEERKKPKDPFRLLTDQEVAAGDPRPVQMKPVGQYAYQIQWNDGHNTGIYTLKLLHQLSSIAPQEEK